MGSPPTGAATTTVTSLGGVRPIEMASMRMGLSSAIRAWQLDAMRRTAALFIFLWGVMPAMAGEPSSAYTPFDLAKCTQVAAPDEYVFEGSWICPGYDG